MTFKSSKIALTLMFLLCLSTFSFAATNRSAARTAKNRGVVYSDYSVRGVVYSDRSTKNRGVVYSDRSAKDRGVIHSDRH